MMTNTSVLATLLNLQATKSMMAAGPNPTDYKAIVCLFFFGGNDSYNMLVPNEGDETSGEYAEYFTVRGGIRDEDTNPGGLALEQSSLIPIIGQDSRSFGLHPGLAEENGVTAVPDGSTGLAKLYADGNLAFVNNVGSLIERTTRTTFNQRRNLPLGLYSHADLQRHWQTGYPQSRSKITGWAGRMADLFESTNQSEFISMNISLGGMNLFQTGDRTVPYAVGSNGATTLTAYGNTDRESAMYTRMLDGIFPAADNEIDDRYQDLMARSMAQTVRGSAEAAIDFNAATQAVTFQTQFAGESPSSQLQMVAKCIGAREALQQTRQVFFVSYGGFDNHNNLIDSHNMRMPRISRAVKSFWDAMAEIECENDVTLFTASDFARTLGTNGQGSDHAWGGNHFVMGGAVNGGQMYGDYPQNLRDPVVPYFGDLDLGRGRLIPTTSVDELAAELALWFGVSNNESLVDIIPNIRNFYDSDASGSPLGMLS